VYTIPAMDEKSTTSRGNRTLAPHEYWLAEIKDIRTKKNKEVLRRFMLGSLKLLLIAPGVCFVSLVPAGMGHIYRGRL
jgi:hypothetical protein